MKNEQSRAIEVVIFRAKTQYTDEQVTEALELINPVLQDFPGFISRQLSKSEDGQWMDLVRWESLALAQQAATKIMQQEVAGEAFKVIEESSMQLYHFLAASSVLLNPAAKKG